MNGDVIKMKFPAKPDYMIAIRLAVSAIAERAGFGIDDIEDIKVASAEACGLLLCAKAKEMDITVTVGGGLKIEAAAVGETVGSGDAGEMSQYLLEALVDECALNEKNGALKSVTIYKRK